VIDNKVRSCAEAAVGIEQATRSIRPPESSIVQDMRARCETDRWPADAIDCFATMKEGALGDCAVKLSDDDRRAMFTTLGGDESTAIAIARVQLTTMHVGVPACDHLFATTREMLGCERIPVEQRARLGPQVANLWSLPTNLPADAQARMAVVCQQTLDEIDKQAHDMGCN
jgi:hypothetical protein